MKINPIIIKKHEYKIHHIKIKNKMKLQYYIIISFFYLISCHSNGTKTFEIKGSFTNTSSKKIFLAELPFGSTERTIVDTAIIDEKGNFTLSTINKGEGLYQIYVEKGPGLMLINDVDQLEIHVDANKLGDYTTPGSRANEDMKKMFNAFIQQDSIFQSKKILLDSLEKANGNDSTLQLVKAAADKSISEMKKILNDFITTQPNGTAVYFAVGMAKQLNTENEWNSLLQVALKRFTHHPGLQLLKVDATSENSMDQQGQQLIGKTVADITLPDTDGKPVAVSSFRGKWLLIDFWASWCAPCRAENPNVVAAYRQFKDKNFTILGISLDLQKNAWLKAIQQDGLTWTHVSDLQQWQSKAVEVYGFNGIPFNILVDPSGKVVAVNLRGAVLEEILSQKFK